VPVRADPALATSTVEVATWVIDIDRVTGAALA
jgi:hypothetical protein